MNQKLTREEQEEMIQEYINSQYLYLEEFCCNKNIEKQKMSVIISALKKRNSDIIKSLEEKNRKEILSRYDDAKNKFYQIINIIKEQEDILTTNELLVLIIKKMPMNYVFKYCEDIILLKEYGINLERKTEIKEKIEELVKKNGIGKLFYINEFFIRK